MKNTLAKIYGWRITPSVKIVAIVTIVLFGVLIAFRGCEESSVSDSDATKQT